MNIYRTPDPIDALVIEETFDQVDRAAILKEARDLLKGDDGVGHWLYEAYEDVKESQINNAVLNNYFVDEVNDELNKMNSLYGIYRNINMHSTVVNYYGHAQSSPMRYDSAAFIAKSFLYDGSNFYGGDLTLQIDGDVAYEQEVSDNITVIFPASYFHQISEVSMIDRDLPNSGLYVITSYLFIEGHGNTV